MAGDDDFVGGMTKLKKRIATIRAKFSLPPLIDDIGQLLLKRTIDRFDRQVDPNGTPWAALASSTRRIRRNLGFRELPALNRSGQLRSAIQLIKSKAGEGSLYINTGAGVRIGVSSTENANYVRATSSPRATTVAEVAHYMQKGTNRAPARKFLGIGRLDIKAVDSLLRRRADEAMRE